MKHDLSGIRTNGVHDAKGGIGGMLLFQYDCSVRGCRNLGVTLSTGKQSVPTKTAERLVLFERAKEASVVGRQGARCK